MQKNAALKKWLKDEMQRQRLKYKDLAERSGDARGLATFWRFINEDTDLTLPMVSSIAAAFGVTRLEVLRRAGFISVKPEDLQGENFGALEIYEIARKLPVKKQKELIRIAMALFDDGGA